MSFLYYAIALAYTPAFVVVQLQKATTNISHFVVVAVVVVIHSSKYRVNSISVFCVCFFFCEHVWCFHSLAHHNLLCWYYLVDVCTYIQIEVAFLQFYCCCNSEQSPSLSLSHILSFSHFLRVCVSVCATFFHDWPLFLFFDWFVIAVGWYGLL